MPAPNPQASAHAATATSVRPEDIPEVCAALRASFDGGVPQRRDWRLAQLRALDRLLVEGRGELCEGMLLDLHKSKFEGYMQEIALVRQEVFDAIAHLDGWMADEAVGTNLFNVPARSVVRPDPLGVVLVLGAWNYNVLLSLQPLVGALAAGNCVVVKPGSYSVGSGAAMSRLIARYLDPACVRCVEGNRHVTTALLGQRWDMIFFTGSPHVGRMVAEAAAKQLCPVVLELGGKSPLVVDKSADLPTAARRAAWGALLNSGQTCVRPDYMLVHEAVADAFLKLLVASIKQFYGAAPQRSEWYGRMVNDAAFRRMARCVEDGRARIVHGGELDAAARFVAPTVFDFGADQLAFEASELMQDEVFGPLIPVLRYKDNAQALALIRARPKPLAMYVFATDGAVAEAFLRHTSSGGAVVNDCIVHLSNDQLPFGGVGEAGMGSYHGKRSFDAFSHQKAVLFRTPYLDVPIRYPPYTAAKQRVLSAAFNPALGHYFAKLTGFASDGKNLVIGALLAANVAQLARRSKL